MVANILFFIKCYSLFFYFIAQKKRSIPVKKVERLNYVTEVYLNSEKSFLSTASIVVNSFSSFTARVGMSDVSDS